MYGLAILSRTGTVDPVTLMEIKAHVNQDHDYDDTLLTSLVAAASEMVEESQGKIFRQASMRLTLPNWPAMGVFYLPRYPVQSVTSIEYLPDGEDDWVTWAASNYRTQLDTLPPTIVTKKDIVLPTTSLEAGNVVRVTFVAGYANGAVPEKAKHAIKLLVAHWYANREAVTTGTIATVIPDAYRSLIMGDRLW